MQHRTLARWRFIGPLGVLLLLGACASTDDEDAYVERPATEIYTEAERFLDDGDWEEAAKAFEEVERQHPYSQWATQAQLMAAFSYYQGSLYDDAIAALDAFIDLHPGNEDVPYALYLTGMSYYEQISDVGRDQAMTRDALRTFEELSRRYSSSAYAKDARLKIDLARDHLAGKEMEIGRYYQDRGRYVAAINRFDAVVDGYQTTTHVPEALLRLVECYLALGVADEARAAAGVLGYNFPDSTWYARAYELMETHGVAALPAGGAPAAGSDVSGT